MSAVVDFPVKPEARPYLDAAARIRPGEPDWLTSRRRRALARFAEQGFPSRRGEAWRYLDLRPLAEAPLLPAGATTAQGEGGAASRLAELGVAGAAARLVLVDGCFSPYYRQPTGCRREPSCARRAKPSARGRDRWRPRSTHFPTIPTSPLRR